MNFNSKNGKYFWSNGYQYGTIVISENGKNKLVKLTSMNGPLSLQSFTLNGTGEIKFKSLKLFSVGKEVEFTVINNDITAGTLVNAIQK